MLVKSLVVVGLLAWAAGSAAAQSRIMVLGDSWAELSTDQLGKFCKGATVVNKGISSSKAKEWAESSKTCPGGEARSCDAAAAFAGETAPFSHVWLSVGGNDYLDHAGCALTENALKARVEQAIDRVKAAAPTAAIVMTGYCAPIVGLGACTDAPGMHQRLNGAIAGACEAKGATFVDSWGACGAGPSSWTPTFTPNCQPSYVQTCGAKTHRDGIHANAQGYCRVFTQPEVQAALACSPAQYDCSIPAEKAGAVQGDGGGGGRGGGGSQGGAATRRRRRGAATAPSPAPMPALAPKVCTDEDWCKEVEKAECAHDVHVKALCPKTCCGCNKPYCGVTEAEFAAAEPAAEPEQESETMMQLAEAPAARSQSTLASASAVLASGAVALAAVVAMQRAKRRENYRSLDAEV